MFVTFRDSKINVRLQDGVTPRKFKLGDLIVTPKGMVRVVTVQKDCPRWEGRGTKVVVIFETEDGEKVPVNGAFGEWEVLRPC